MISVGKSKFDKQTLAHFFEEMRAIGMEGRYLLPHQDYLQYVVCGVFSREEFESCEKDNSQIQRFTQYLLNLNDERRERRFTSKFLHNNGRIAVLLNNWGRHGEARLFDQNGTLLYQLGIRKQDEENNVFETYRYLDVMKEKFIDEFGAEEEPFIVLFSQKIPCTAERHECARIIREYVNQTADKVIVSYDDEWYGTDTTLSLQHMTHENIGLIPPSIRREIVNREVRSIDERINYSNSIVNVDNESEKDNIDYDYMYLDCLENYIGYKRKKKERLVSSLWHHRAEIGKRKGRTRESSKYDLLP